MSKINSIQFHVFGCQDCKVLILDHPMYKTIKCPKCHRTIDVYAAYSELKVSMELELTSMGIDYVQQGL